MEKVLKKDGNAILIVLIISMTLVIVGGVVTTAVMNTTKGNANSKINEDLLYVAESGIEKVRSNIRLGLYDLEPISTSVELTTIDLNSEFTTYNYKLKVHIWKVEAGKYKVESVADNRPGSKTKIVNANITKRNPGSLDIFKYIFCGQNVKIEGPVGYIPTPVNSVNEPSFSTGINSSPVNREPFSKTNFLFAEKVWTVGEPTVLSEIDLNAAIKIEYTMIPGQLPNVTTLASDSAIKGVVKFDYTPLGGYTYTIYLVNNADLEIIQPTPYVLNNKIIISNSKILIDVPSMNITTSTIVSDFLHIKSPGSITGGFASDSTLSTLKEEDFVNINYIISKFASGWDLGLVPEPGTSEIDVEYKY